MVVLECTTGTQQESYKADRPVVAGTSVGPSSPLGTYAAVKRPGLQRNLSSGHGIPQVCRAHWSVQQECTIPQYRTVHSTSVAPWHTACQYCTLYRKVRYPCSFSDLGSCEVLRRRG
eukprot:2276551-Rhodomonas_salina.3